MTKIKMKYNIIMLLIIIFITHIGFAITESDNLIIDYDNKFNENGMIDTDLTIKSNSEVKSLKIQIVQVDTVLDSTLGFFDTSSGPIGYLPEVKPFGNFGYMIPSLEPGQYVKMRFISVSNKKCAEVIAGRLVLTFEGGQNEKELKVNIPCENDGSKTWKYISIILILLVIVVVVAIIISKRRGL